MREDTAQNDKIQEKQIWFQVMLAYITTLVLNERHLINNGCSEYVIDKFRVYF